MKVQIKNPPLLMGVHMTAGGEKRDHLEYPAEKQDMKSTNKALGDYSTSSEAQSILDYTVYPERRIMGRGRTERTNCTLIHAYH